MLINSLTCGQINRREISSPGAAFCIELINIWIIMLRVLASVSKLMFIPDFEQSEQKLPDISIQLMNTTQAPHSGVGNITVCRWIFSDAPEFTYLVNANCLASTLLHGVRAYNYFALHRVKKRGHSLYVSSGEMFMSTVSFLAMLVVWPYQQWKDCQDDFLQTFMSFSGWIKKN